MWTVPRSYEQYLGRYVDICPPKPDICLAYAHIRAHLLLNMFSAGVNVFSSRVHEVERVQIAGVRPGQTGHLGQTVQMWTRGLLTGGEGRGVSPPKIPS